MFSENLLRCIRCSPKICFAITSFEPKPERVVEKKKKHDLNGYQTLYDLSSIIWSLADQLVTRTGQNLKMWPCYLACVVNRATCTVVWPSTHTHYLLVILCFHNLQILALRLLRAVLPSWDVTKESCRMSEVVARLFALLGRVLMTCHGSLPIQPPLGMLKC